VNGANTSSGSVRWAAFSSRYRRIGRKPRGERGEHDRLFLPRAVWRRNYSCRVPGHRLVGLQPEKIRASAAPGCPVCAPPYSPAIVRNPKTGACGSCVPRAPDRECQNPSNSATLVR